MSTAINKKSAARIELNKTRSLDPTDPLLEPLVSPLALQSFTCENSQRGE